MSIERFFPMKKSPPAVIWIVVFLVSLLAMFYLGLRPELIDKWYLYLVIYNVGMSLVASYFIVISIRKLRRDTQKDVVGSKFTWSFVRMIPVLVLLPVLSFYLFSFESIRDNLQRAGSQFDVFNMTVRGEVDELYRNTAIVSSQYYKDRANNVALLVNYYDVPRSTNEKMQRVLEQLIIDDWACELTLYNAEMELVATHKNTEIDCLDDGYTASTDQFILVARFSLDYNIDSLTKRMTRFRNAAREAELSLNDSIIKTRFMIDFSSTLLLAVLCALLVVLRMIDQLMRPMHNLSLATREIAAGNYDVKIEHDPKNKDLHGLIVHFNEMSRQIKLSREGLDTHNLYLETILKYSYGVIALNHDKTIQLINPVIGKMLKIDIVESYVGLSYVAITENHKNLEPLFSYIDNNIKQDKNEWSGEVEIMLSDRYRLLYCQGAILNVEDKSLGYVIMVNDITKLNRAQKKAAWGQVAVRMAHEIKNPLTPILLSAQRLRNLFLNKLDPKDSKVIDKTTKTIIDQVKSMDSMVSAFANYANTPEIQRIASSLNTLVNKAVSLYDEQDGVRIDLDLSGDLPKLQLDKDSISRILINLIKNSDESRQDEGEINILIQSRYIQSENIVRLTVTDNGNGFPESLLDKVFEPYTTTKSKGGGLGLAIVQNIVEQHEGQIFASNIEPHGARITIEFSIITVERESDE